MAYLIVSGVTVKVSVTGSSKTEMEIGDSARAFDGTYRSTVRARKRVYHIRTVPTLRATIDTLETALKSTTLPLVCSGDFMGATVNCFPVLENWDPTTQGGNTHLATVTFSLHEA